MWWYSPLLGAEQIPPITREGVDTSGAVDSGSWSKFLNITRSAVDVSDSVDSGSYVQALTHQRTGVDVSDSVDSASWLKRTDYIPPPVPVYGIAPIRPPHARAWAPPASWTIDGKPVLVGKDWSAVDEVDQGFGQFRGAILEEDLRRLRVQQMSTVVGRRRDGSVLYEGRLTSDPSISRGIAALEAQGYAVEAVKLIQRLLYATRHYGIFGQGDAPPYTESYSGQNGLTGSVESNCLRYAMAPNSPLLNGTMALLIAACPGNPGGFTRVKFEHVANFTTSLYSIRGWAGPYPTGIITGANIVGAVDTSSSPSTVTWTIPNKEAFALGTVYDGITSTSGGPGNWLIRNLVLNGIATGDTMVASAVIADMFARLGWSTSKVLASTRNLLPYDVNDQSVADAMSYISTLEDRWWVARESDGGQVVGEYGQYEKVWTTDRAYGAEVNLVPLERFNRVVVTYRDPSGVLQSVTKDVAPDPLAGTGKVNVRRIPLQDVQADSTLANSVATQAAAREALRQWTGEIVLHGARDVAGRGGPHAVRSGELARVSDFTDPAALHRIVQIEYRATEARARISTPSFESILAKQMPYLGPPAELPPEEPAPPAEGGEEPLEPGEPIEDIPEGRVSPPGFGQRDQYDDDEGFGHPHKRHHGGAKPRGGWDHPHRKHHR